MNNLFDRADLLRRRERAAVNFAEHDFLLSHVGSDFADRLSAILRDFGVVVNLGAYNGALIVPLSSCRQFEAVLHLDSCATMLADRRQGLSVVADEQTLPLKEASVDLVVSAFALHFVNDLPGVLSQIRRSLRPDGLMMIALPGARTLYELRDSFAVAESEIEGGVSPRIGPFSDIRDCGSLLQRAGFALPVVDSYELSVSYENVFALMRELRAMGAGNVLRERRRKALRKETVMRLAEVYADRYGLADGRISATFEIVVLTGWSPHDSQQKPLRPGSAQAKLADALGVQERKI